PGRHRLLAAGRAHPVRPARPAQHRLRSHPPHLRRAPAGAGPAGRPGGAEPGALYRDGEGPSGPLRHRARLRARPAAGRARALPAGHADGRARRPCRPRVPGRGRRRDGPAHPDPQGRDRRPGLRRRHRHRAGAPARSLRRGRPRPRRPGRHRSRRARRRARDALRRLGESTLLRPAGAALAPASPAPLAAETGEDGAEQKQPTTAWPFVTLAAVLIVVLGVGATLGARYFLVPEPDPIATTQINVPVTKQEAPGEPTDIEFQIISSGEGTEKTGRIKVSWEPPAGYTQEDHYLVRWKDLPEQYTDRYGAQIDVYGHNSHLLEIPPQLSPLCVEVQTVNPNGAASAPVEECLEIG